MSRWSAGSRSTNRITDRRQRCWSRFIIGAVSIDAEIAVAGHRRSPIDRPASREGARRAPNEHIAELRKSAAEAAAKLKRLHDAIENGIADVSDPLLEERVTELKSVRDQARAERAAGALDRAVPSIAPQVLKTFARGPAGGCEPWRAATVATISARSPSGSRSTHQRFGSWVEGPAASHARRRVKLQVLACPVLYRSGAPDTIRTCGLYLRRVALYPAELRVPALLTQCLRGILMTVKQSASIF